MYLNSDVKTQIFSKYSKGGAKDTGSAEAQIALHTYRINHLTEHLKGHKKDVSTRTGLLRLVGKRRRLLDYLFNTDIERYRNVVKEMGIRK